MSNTITVSASRMGQDREHIGESMERAAAGVGELRDAMLALSACWEGPAWETFQNEVHESLNEMYELYSFFSEYVYRNKESESEYQKCENVNRDMMWRVWI